MSNTNEVVRRHTFSDESGWEQDDGDWVKYSDYQVLESKFKKLEKQLAAANERIQLESRRADELHGRRIGELELENKRLREALEQLSLYEAVNGDCWVNRMAKQALGGKE